MAQEIEQYEDNAEFLEFLNRQFNKTAANATIEEFAQFAFGSVNEAIIAFNKYRDVNVK